eukprot:364230-Chlamydomonas_euryale.AAC.7
MGHVSDPKFVSAASNTARPAARTRMPRRCCISLAAGFPTCVPHPGYRVSCCIAMSDGWRHTTARTTDVNHSVHAPTLLPSSTIREQFAFPRSMLQK